jgi:hypothetical protein
LAWAFVIKFLNKGIKLTLLLQNTDACRTSGFFLQREVHAFVVKVHAMNLPVRATTIIFICNNCSKVFDTKACLDGLKKMIAPGFRITGHEIILYGNCANCRHSYSTQFSDRS